MPTNPQTQPDSQPQEQPEESLDQEEFTEPENDNSGNFIAENQNDVANPDERLRAMDERMGQNLEDVRTAIYGSKDKSKDKDALDPQANEINQKPGDKPTEDKKPEDSTAKAGASPNQSKADKIKDTIKSGRDKVSNTFNRAREIKRGAEAAGDVKNMSAEYAKEKIKKAIRDAVVKNAKRVAAQIARSVATAVAGFIAANLPIILGALAIIVVIVGIVSLVATFWGFGRDTGRGAAIYPAEARHPEIRQGQAMVLSALTDNRIAQTEFIRNIIEEERKRYEQRILANATNITRSQELVDKINEKKTYYFNELDLLLGARGNQRKEIRDRLNNEMGAFEKTELPFGEWIAHHAKRIHREDPVLPRVCPATGAAARVQCASFTSRVLWHAGVPNSIVPTTMQIWNMPFLTTVVDRSRPSANQSAKPGDPINPNLYEQNKNIMRPGDIVWWGNGVCSRVVYENKLFDHVGIYIGNDRVIDTTFDREENEGRVVERRVNFMHNRKSFSSDDRFRGQVGHCRFNGVKRYGR